jgi:hypothetical protein
MGTSFPNAIEVSPLACYKEWPILLTDHADASPIDLYAANAISALGITSALKVGTYVPLPAGVEGGGNCSGADRYSTCANVAQWGKLCAGLTFTHTGLVTGDKFPDALAAGPCLGKDNGILLLAPLYGPLPAPVGALLSANAADVRRFSLIAVLEPVIGQVKGLLP